MKKIYIIKCNKHYFTYDDKFYTYDFYMTKSLKRPVGRFKLSYSPFFKNKLSCINFNFMIKNKNKNKIRNKKNSYYYYDKKYFNSKPETIKFYRLD